MSLKFIPLERTVVRIDGDDRVSFLNNFCTADIKLLEPNEITEAFILNGKGKIVAHVLVLCSADAIEFNTVAGQGGAIISHLDRYLIREDVTLSDISSQRKHVFVFGNLNEATGLPEFNRFSDGEIQIAHCEAAGVGVLVSAANEQQVTDWANQLGGCAADESTLNLHRVQFGTPWFGVDSSAENLPQELVRDEKAISFTKGCYLGQETVARIDALGRVNKLMVKIQSAEKLSSGESLTLDDKMVGTLSSIAHDGTNWHGISIVKRAAAKPGTVLKTELGTAKVV